MTFVLTQQVAEAGLERVSKTSDKTALYDKSGAESGALGPRFVKVPSDLRKIIDTWPILPAATKKAVMALIQAEEGKGG